MEPNNIILYIFHETLCGSLNAEITFYMFVHTKLYGHKLSLVSSEQLFNLFYLAV